MTPDGCTRTRKPFWSVSRTSYGAARGFEIADDLARDFLRRTYRSASASIQNFGLHGRRSVLCT